MLSAYHQRKAARLLDYLKIHGKKLITCTACNGSGRYDDKGSPRCGLCNGTGKVRER